MTVVDSLFRLKKMFWRKMFVVVSSISSKSSGRPILAMIAFIIISVIQVAPFFKTFWNSSPIRLSISLMISSFLLRLQSDGSGFRYNFGISKGGFLIGTHGPESDIDYLFHDLLFCSLVGCLNKNKKHGYTLVVLRSVEVWVIKVAVVIFFRHSFYGIGQFIPYCFQFFINAHLFR